jgi:hypothetical protein
MTVSLDRPAGIGVDTLAVDILSMTLCKAILRVVGWIEMRYKTDAQ